MALYPSLSMGRGMSSFTIPKIESSAAFESVANHGDVYIYIMVQPMV